MRVYVPQAGDGYPTEEAFLQNEIRPGAYGPLEPASYPVAERLLALHAPSIPAGTDRFEVVGALLAEDVASFLIRVPAGARFSRPHYVHPNVFVPRDGDYEAGIRAAVEKTLAEANAELAQLGRSYRRARRWRNQLHALEHERILATPEPA